MTRESIDRNALAARAEALGWPTVGVQGFGITGEAQWRPAIRRCFPVELEDLARQLDRIEATRPVRTEPARLASDPLPLLSDEEYDQVVAERATRDQIARESLARRRAEAENKRLTDQGIGA
jgi:hypothetical protein